MSSGTSTEAAASRDAGFRVWHFYLLLSMSGATAAVVLSRHTHPAALILLSAAVLAAGAAAYALHTALIGFWTAVPEETALAETDRQVLEREKALVLRSIKELEFDRAMKKVGDADFADMSGRLRTRALTIMADLERAPAPRPAAAKPPPAELEVPVERAGTARAIAAAICGACQATNDADARFCKRCGARLIHD